jgi:sterol desaturase/sphingolipid hydroxylase (fatty acid hydroxylase superfamily)
MTAGHAEGLVIALVHVVVISLLFVLERVDPFEPLWQRSYGDVGTDLIHGAVSMISLPELIKLGLFPLLFMAGAWASDLLGHAVWPMLWPVPAQLVLAAAIAEFPQYWIHRWMHEKELLWRLHATHHSPRRLYWLNAARFHPLDTVINYLACVTPLIVMGCPPKVLALWTVLTGVHGLFQHCNVDFRLGPLNWVFSCAELHRWHHSRILREANTNYGANLILWDVVFRTRFHPHAKPPSEIGLSDMPDFPQGYWGQLLSPIRWPKRGG